MLEIISNFVTSIFDFSLKKIFRRLEKPVLDLNLLCEDFGKNNIAMCGESGKTYDISKEDMPIMWEFIWKYRLEIRNNSSYTAYRVKIIKQNPQSNKMRIVFPTIDVTIKANEARVFDCYITHQQKETVHKSKKLLKRYPFFLEDSNISIEISYTNESKRQFRSQFCIDKNSTIQDYKPFGE